MQPCGTNAAYARHLRNKEVACAKCLAAHAEAIRRHKHKDDDRELTQKAYLSSRKKPDGQIKPASLKRREQRAR
ncbi:MAG TPA: hypothetical protein VJQ25_06490, partial [Nitrospira sp.]|nr:hypothetical protein [Nitrospira sp.]